MAAVHGKKFYGYQGFTPTHLVHPPSMKNGETREFLKNKYETVGQGQVYNKSIISSALNFDDRTLDKDMFAVVSADDYKHNGPNKAKSFKEDRGDVSLRSKPFIGTTMYNTTFRDFGREARDFQTLELEDLRGPFEQFSDGRTGELPLKKIQEWLDAALGSEVPSWIMLKFLKTFDENTSGRFSWSELSASFPDIMRAIKADTSRNVAGKPEWLIASKKMPPKVLTAAAMKSASQIATVPFEDRKFLHKTGMWSCDNDMLAGTTRDTFHIPGYAGHIPVSRRNPVVQTQGDAREPRMPKNNLRLIYSHDLPGYTGHQPKAARNDVGEKKGGRDPRTTAGSAALGEDIL